jgi:hypothetical protein
MFSSCDQQVGQNLRFSSLTVDSWCCGSLTQYPTESQRKTYCPSTTYITFGYHVHDCCFQFETQLQKIHENEVDVLTFIRHVYFYHVNRALYIPTKLKRWAIDIARPYLLNNLPSALTPDISDPRNAQMDYEEPE